MDTLADYGIGKLNALEGYELKIYCLVMVKTAICIQLIVSN